MRTRLLAIAVLSACSCAAPQAPPRDPPALPPGAEAISLQDEPLFPPPLKPEETTKREAALAAARAAHTASPGDADALIEYGRRTAALGHFREAITIFTQGIVAHPDDARLYRHRGHRYITLRLFDLAVRDLEKSEQLVRDRPDEVEPPMTPNARGVALGSLKHNVYYHLALAHVLRGDFEKALPAWRECVRWSKDPDSLCSATHWLYSTLRRLGRDAEAKAALEPIRADMDIVEYRAYHRLCLLYKGELDADAVWEEARAGDPAGTDLATVGYGVGNWQLCEGRRERALEIFRAVAAAPLWPAFGRIAAEAELARLR